jgi:hypothetical protein
MNPRSTLRGSRSRWLFDSRRAQPLRISHTGDFDLTKTPRIQFRNSDLFDQPVAFHLPAIRSAISEAIGTLKVSCWYALIIRTIQRMSVTNAMTDPSMLSTP